MDTALTLYRRSELQEVNQGCLYRVKQIWGNGVPDESPIATLGIVFHRIKHLYVLKLVDQQIEQDVELAQEAFVEGCAAAQAPSWILPELRELWERHAERYELHLPSFVAAEERQSSGGVAFTPDLVTANTRINELEIHDDKTGWMPPMSEDELRVLYQARVYARFAADRWPGFSSYRFTIHAIRFNVQTSVVFSPEELDQIEREVRADIATYEEAKRTDSWPATAGPSCRFCTLACPLMDQTPAVMPKRLATVEQAAQVGQWALAAQGMLKAAKAALKGYCSAHGPLDVHGVVWDNRPSDARSYPLEVVFEAMRVLDILGVGADPKQQALTISHSALTKLFKAHPKLETDLLPYVQTKTTYRFSARQAGADDEDE